MKIILKALLMLCLFYLFCSKTSQNILFFDDFENGCSKWNFVNPDKIRIVHTGDLEHMHVLELIPGGQSVYALIKNSDKWTNFKVEGDVLYPEDFHNYMGLIYNYQVNGSRTDFGSIYIKGNDSYIRVNPHRDGNASRTLYEEYKTPLTGQSAIHVGEWQHFKAEIMGSTCHFYVGDMEVPQITFQFHEFLFGQVGFKPRVYGSSCWLDHICVSSISSFHYEGPPLPQAICYQKEEMITKWDAIGPFYYRNTEIEKEDYNPEKLYPSLNEEVAWKSFDTDGRGCVLVGRLSEFNSWKNKVYFHTSVLSERSRKALLSFSTRNDLTLWVNGENAGRLLGADYCWFDFMKNPDHAGQKLSITLKPGTNHILVLVQGGRYGGDGFFAALE